MLKQGKLMVNLCGLALSSLFVINNKSVVHADMIDNQNSAITWNSDSDDSQSVQNSQNLVNDNVQITDKTNTEISTVRSSSEQRPLINQTKAAEIGSATDNQSSGANLVSKVDDAPADKPVTITNPSNNQVHVHYVNANGDAISNVTDDTINTSKVIKQGTYKVPTGYMLKNPNGKYDIAVTSTDYGILYNAPNFDGYHDGNNSKFRLPSSRKSLKLTADEVIKFAQYVRRAGDGDIDILLTSVQKTNDGLVVGRYYVDTTMDSDEGTYEGHSYDIEPTIRSYGDFNADGPSFVKFSDKEAGAIVKKISDQLDTLPAYSDGIHYMYASTGSHTNAIFTDDSGNVTSVSGNTVNVVLTKPQNVDPATDARMKAIATRTIQINFPGTIPPSYKNIVNDKGELIQTVTFTRTGQEDALTGNLIDNTLTPWKSNNQDHNFIGFEARTLPRIPGYTLSIKPV